MEHSVARVHLLDAPYHIDKGYDYYIPEDLRGLLTVGGFVAVPFGGGNHRQLALISELVSVSNYQKLKPVLMPVCAGITLSSEMMGLARFMKEHCLCTIGDAVKAMIPKAALTRITEYYEAVSPRPTEKKLSPRAEAVLHYIEMRGKTAYDVLLRENGQNAAYQIARLTADGFLTREEVFRDARTVERESVRLNPPYDEMENEAVTKLVRGEKQRTALSALLLCGTLPVSEMRDRYGVSKTTLTALIEKGIISMDTEEIYRDPYRQIAKKDERQIELSAQQKAAKETILSLFRTGLPKAVLLFGVTGSGKTSVMRAVMDEVIAEGRQVILMVPEIALTPQTVGIFRAHFGERVAVVHSGLSRGERFDAYRRIERGEVDICIGTRSAVFAPFSRLGLIVMDEEQEHSYKSDMDPKYHARDIARYRCAAQNATLLLASATPSLESFHKAKEGKYTLVSLTERYGKAVLPETMIADRRQDARCGNLSPLGAELRSRLAEVLQRKEQAILFINQRGYNRFLSCPLCGHVLMCPNCSVSYTYHTRGSSDRGYLFCHYCGSREAVPKKCPQCGNEVLKHIGHGTQFVEEALHELFPEARVMRMDADTTAGKFSYEHLLSRFRSGGADLLIGTQMVTKGHDFPGVTLVGVIAADASLYLNDYQANERTFDLLTQVIGRAGRGEKPGCALIQTFNPEHPILMLAAEQDYQKLYENEIALRRSLVFPPFCDMVLFTLSSVAENELNTASRTFIEELNRMTQTDYADVPIVVFGPMEAPLYKINGVYRQRVVIKCRLNDKTRRLLSDVYIAFGKIIGRKVTVSVDVNPSNL